MFMEHEELLEHDQLNISFSFVLNWFNHYFGYTHIVGTLYSVLLCSKTTDNPVIGLFLVLSITYFKLKVDFVRC